MRKNPRDRGEAGREWKAGEIQATDASGPLVAEGGWLLAVGMISRHEKSF